MSSPHAALLVIAVALSSSSKACAEEPARLPEPLDGVTTDLGLLKQYFKLNDAKLLDVGEFETLGNPARVIAEQTLVWELEAKADLSGRMAAGLFERPAFPRVRFYAIDDGKRKSADARDAGYFLVTDRRWIGGDGAPLTKGDRITVYAPIGKTGAADLEKNGAAIARFEKAKPAEQDGDEVD